MTMVAEIYRFFVILETEKSGKASPQVRREFQSLDQSLTATIDALNDLQWSWGALFKDVEDGPEDILGDLTQVRENTRKALSLFDLFKRKRRSTKEKIARRVLIENALWTWIVVCNPDAQHTVKVSTEMIDFIWAAVTPVLVDGDKFNSDAFAGRDALGKVIDAIRREGMRLNLGLPLAELMAQGNSASS
jgi:hypothetical protein